MHKTYVKPSVKGNKTVNLMDIEEADPAEWEAQLSYLNFDFKQLAADTNRENAAIRERVWQQCKGYNFEMRSEVRRLRSFLTYRNLSSWCPKKMAGAGCYFTGVENSIQCFCCGLVLCSASVRTPPYEKHLKYNPGCEFIQGKDVGNIPKYDVRVQLPEITRPESEDFVGEESRLKTFASWPSYARIPPVELAGAGFFFTGKRDAVQCFSCGGCLCHWEENDDVWKEHAKWFPECDFLQNMRTRNEIQQYIKSYDGYDGYTGKHFLANIYGQTLNTIKKCANLGIFEDEGVRLDSFTCWPENPHANPNDLARCGFYYTGLNDFVKCFTCGICIGFFEVGDVPFNEHLKHSPQCEFLQTLVNQKHEGSEHDGKTDNISVPVVKENEVQDNNVIKTEMGIMNYVGIACYSPADRKYLDFPDERRHTEWANLKRQLMEIYNGSGFSKSSPFVDSSQVSVNLKSLFADISVVLKDTRNRPVQQLTLPDILSNLSDIIMIEGEAGSGKTALLRKIAILWASGSCPILNRFSLVFYISVSAIENQQTLSDIICRQLVGSESSLTEKSLAEIVRTLGNRILFLIDDYSEMDVVHGAIEELLLRNPATRVNLAVAVYNGMGKKLRQLARTVFSIQELPLYSSMYIYRELFCHDIEFLENFIVRLLTSKTLQAILKTPLFACALCIYWVKNPNGNLSEDIVICRAYQMYIMRKHAKETDRLKALLASCGDLALNGLFQAHFDFTEKDVCAAGVDKDHALRCGLLSKFTSQRLRPIYRFFHPCFLEFLSGKRLSQLLDSDDKVQVDTAISYVRRIKNFTQFAGRYYVFLEYCCINSSRTSLLIITHLFELLNKSEAFDYEDGVMLHFEHHPQLACDEEMLNVLRSNNPDLHLSFVIHMLLVFAINVAQKGNCLNECAPVILQFLNRKNICINLSYPNMSLLTFLSKYPEGLALISSLEVSVPDITSGEEELQHSVDFGSQWNVPVVDKDYSKAFKLLSAKANNKYEKNYLCRSKTCISDFGFTQSDHKISILRVEARGKNVVEGNIADNLLVFLSLSCHIELVLKKCPGFVKNVATCIEQHRTSFIKCVIFIVELTIEEQELITKMSSLESLQIINTTPPEYILSHLNNFKHLKELTLDLSGCCDAFEMMVDGFKKLHCLEKIAFKNIGVGYNSSRLADCISNFPDLKKLHFTYDMCPDFENLMAAICKHGNICELNLHGLFIKESEMTRLASSLSSLRNLKVLNLEGQHFVDIGGANIFAQSLMSLIQLEELSFPCGPGIMETITSVIKQLKIFPNLRKLGLKNNILNDRSLLKLAKEARRGHLSNIQTLELNINYIITQSGWKDFFHTLDNLPNLIQLHISRIYTHQYKTDPSTLVALVQCVSRLHNLNLLAMHGWLLDNKDLEMFNSMKQKHPQGKSFTLIWQWLLPFRPIVED